MFALSQKQTAYRSLRRAVPSAVHRFRSIRCFSVDGIGYKNLRLVPCLLLILGKPVVPAALVEERGFEEDKPDGHAPAGEPEGGLGHLRTAELIVAGLRRQDNAGGRDHVSHRAAGAFDIRHMA